MGFMVGVIPVELSPTRLNTQWRWGATASDRLRQHVSLSRGGRCYDFTLAQVTAACFARILCQQTKVILQRPDDAAGSLTPRGDVD